MRHITFDEMTEVIFSNKASSELNALSDKINAHILFCDECYEIYSGLLQFKETVEKKAERMSIGDVSSKLLHALCAVCGDGLKDTDDLYETFSSLSEDVENVCFKTEGGEMALLYATSPFVRLNGVSENVIGDVGGGVEGQTARQGQFADERMTFKNGSVHINIPKKGYSAEDILFVVSDGLEAPEYVLFEEEKGCLKAEVSCPCDGEYTLMIGRGCRKYLSLGEANSRNLAPGQEDLKDGSAKADILEIQKNQRVEQRVRNWNARKEYDNKARFDLTRFPNNISAASFKSNDSSYKSVGFEMFDYSEDEKKK